MRIEIDKKTGVLLAIIALLAGGLIALAVNRNNNDMGMDEMGGGMHANHRAQSSATYTGADIMFLQMMIPHHQQAIDISNIALKTSKDSELLTLARAIRDGQSAEIIQMKKWLDDAGAGTDMGHSMSGMGGMLTQSELSDLSAATGKNFDTLWLKGMTGHHDGALHMVTMIRDASNPDIKAFGENVVKVQSAQIDQMKAMLTRLG